MLERIFGSDVSRLICSYIYHPRDAYDLGARDDLEGISYLMLLPPPPLVEFGTKCTAPGCTNWRADPDYLCNYHRSMETEDFIAARPRDEVMFEIARGAIWNNHLSVLELLLRIKPQLLAQLYEALRTAASEPLTAAPAEIIRAVEEPRSTIAAMCKARGIRTFTRTKLQLVCKYFNVDPRREFQQRADLVHWIDKNLAHEYHLAWLPKYGDFLTGRERRRCVMNRISGVGLAAYISSSVKARTFTSVYVLEARARCCHAPQRLIRAIDRGLAREKCARSAALLSSVNDFGSFLS